MYLWKIASDSNQGMQIRVSDIERMIRVSDIERMIADVKALYIIGTLVSWRPQKGKYNPTWNKQTKLEHGQPLLVRPRSCMYNIGCNIAVADSVIRCRNTLIGHPLRLDVE